MEQRLIDANALLDIENIHIMWPSIDHYCLSKKAILIEDIKNAPTIDPVKHGRWIDDGTHDTCSICNLSVARYDEYDYRQYFDYCPNCGARMDGGTP